ncbi:MAG: AAA family ATPase, partial [Acidimicrobiia bacterium]
LEADRLLEELAGRDEDPDPAVAAVAAQLEPVVAAVRAAFTAWLEEPSLFAAVAARAGLCAAEAEVFALLAAVEIDPRRQRLVAYVQDNVLLPRVSLATLRRLFPLPHAGALAVAHSGALRRAGLVEVEDDGPWAARAAFVPVPVVWALLGAPVDDPELPPGTSAIVSSEGDPAGAGLVLVTGPDRTTRRQLAARHAAGTAFLTAPLPASSAAWVALVRAAGLCGCGIILEVDDALPVEAREQIERADHLAWVISSPEELPIESLPERPWIEVRAPDGEADDEDWQRLLGTGRAGGHRLGRDQLGLVARAYEGLGGDLAAAVRRLAGGHLDRMARRIRPRRGWDEIVLPADQLAQLHELASRYRHRDTVYDQWGFGAVPSAGLVALFSGGPGTGKTMAAEVIAGDLGLDVYKVDLSAVVSKYIGETEKNLEKIFSTAAAGGLVLFFDEADSLFGKRSEVSDAHDRYANIEVSYLLQRVESYDGLVVLATNFQKNIDAAFLRRVHVAVDFPLPEEDERRAIWERSFPATAPTADLDLAFLARQFKLSGGAIRNATVHAAFLAVASGEAISMDVVMAGLKRELQKMGRLWAEAGFDRYPGWDEEEPVAASAR